MKVKQQQEIDEDLFAAPNLNGEGNPDLLPYACEVCGSGDREERLLLCDACDLGYHMECLVPPLTTIPRGRWYCPQCTAAGVGQAR